MNWSEASCLPSARMPDPVDLRRFLQGFSADWCCLFTLQKPSCMFESDSYICSGMHRLEQRQWNCRLVGEPLHFHISLFTTSRPPFPPLPGAIPVTPITSERTDVNLILPVCILGTHRSSLQTQRSLSDICPDFEWHQSQSSVTLILSRSRLAYLYPSHLISHSPTGQEY